MENYLQEALANSHIRPSSSPVEAAFVFVEKKIKPYIHALTAEN